MWRDKDPSMVGDQRYQAQVQICNPSPTMDTVPYERNIFKRNVNQLINKEIINKHRSVNISYGKNVYSTSPTIHISETINFIRGLLIISLILKFLYQYDTKKKPSLLLHRERSNLCSVHSKSF